MDTSTRRLIQDYLDGVIDRRRFLARALAAGIGIAGATELLAACGSSTTSTGSGAVSTPQGTPDLQAVIRIASTEDDWPPQGAGKKSTTFQYPFNVNVYEPLIILGSDYTLRPGLAESWELIAPTTWRFHLRKGVTFHDGSKFTADDVVWSWADRPGSPKNAQLGTVGNTLGPDSVKKIDDYTVDFIPVTPNLRLAEQIVHPEGSILPRGKDFDSSPPVGTGPFKVVDYKPSQSVTVERFDGYWGTRPQVRQMAVRFLPDDQTRLQALQSGQVDFIIGLAPQSVSSLEGNTKFRVVRSKPGRNQLIYVNKSGKAPHDLCADPAIRTAVSNAIDRAAYVSTVFENNADPGLLMAPASVLGSSVGLVTPVPYDVAAAKQALDGAGWAMGPGGIRSKNGRQLALDLIGWAEVTPVAFQFLQSQLQQVGIQVNINPAADTPTYQGLYKNVKFDLDLEVPNQNDGNPAFLPVLRMYSKYSGTQNFTAGAEFDAFAEAALAATTEADAQKAAAQMMQILIDKEHIVIPLAGQKRIFGMTASVNLADPHPSLTNQRWDSLAVYKA